MRLDLVATSRVQLPRPPLSSKLENGGDLLLGSSKTMSKTVRQDVTHSVKYPRNCLDKGLPVSWYGPDACAVFTLKTAQDFKPGTP